MLVAFVFNTNAQTTISTAPYASTGYDAANAATGNTFISFAVQNTNSYSIKLNGLETVKSVMSPIQPANNGMFYLWYSATSLSDTATLNDGSWSKIDSVAYTTLSNGYNTVFSNLGFTIPANTTYRFALQSTNGIGFSGGFLLAGQSTYYASPSTISADGVNLLNGNATINAKEVGWLGYYPYSQINLAWFTGSITFSSTVACTSPPVAGNTISTSTNTCKNIPFTLSISGNTSLASQTYQWQVSSNGSSWSDITGATLPTLTTNQSSSNYYRCRVTCSGNSSNSTALQVVTSGGVSGTFTINAGQPASTNNFQTITAAINHISCGINGPVVFNVVPGSGPYVEQVAIPFIGGSSSINTVTINGNGETLSYNFASTDKRAVLTLNDADHIIVDSLNIDCSTAIYGWGILFTNHADSNVIRKCNISADASSTATDHNNIGIIFNGGTTIATNQFGTPGSNGSYNQINNNTINGGEYGIYAFGAGVQNAGNKISGNIVKNFYRWGIGAFYENQDFVISKNDISRPTRNNCFFSLGGGIWISTGCESVLVEKNKIHNLFDAMISNSATCDGIFIAASASIGKENKIINNSIYNLNGDGSTFGITTNGDNIQIYHNTIIIDNQAPSNSEAYGFWQLGSNYTRGVSFNNNLVYMTRNGIGARRCVNIQLAVSVAMNNNAYYYSCVNSSDTNFASIGTAKFGSLADWKASSNNTLDQLSVFADPLFLNAATFDYTPSAPLINDIGANLGVTSDIVDATRGNNPDPGAYEFTIPACTNPPVTGITIASKTDVCSGKSINLTLEGNSFGAGQTYQWQLSANNSNWSNAGNVSTAAQITTTQSNSNYYRCAVQCGSGTVVYSNSVLVTNSPVLSGNYTINNTNPTGGGNFNNFNDAVNAVKCGISGPVVFNVVAGSGPYNEHITIPQITGASATNTITFKGNGATLSYASFDQNNPVGIMLDGADHITIDSLTIDVTGGSYCWGVLLINQADSNTIRKSTVITRADNGSSNFMGIVINGSFKSTASSGNNGNYNSIIDNTIIGGNYGIYLFGTQFASGQNNYNVVKRNKIQDFYSAATYLGYQTTGLVFSDNDISRPTRTNSAFAATGIYLYKGCNQALIARNKIHNFFDAMPGSFANTYCFYLSADVLAGQENKIINNLVYNMNGTAGQYGFYCSQTNNVKIYHNTLIFDNASTTGTIYGFYQNSYATGMDFRNNILYFPTNGGGINRCFYIGDSTSGFISNNNILYMSADPSNVIGRLKGTDYTTLAAWKTAKYNNPYDVASIGVDPLFANMGSLNFKPTAIAADNIGAPVGVATDIDNSPRSNTTPDAGCYEFVGIPLPITGLSLSGEKSSVANKLQWSTLTETNNVGFELLRSTTGINSDFTSISFIPTKAINGNSNAITTYTFNDFNASGNNNYYKLKQLDKNGKFTFSNTILIKSIKSNFLEIVTTYPNPATSNLNVVIASPDYRKATITIADIFGKKIIERNINLNINDNNVSIDINKLSAGNYTIKLSCDNGCESLIKKFVKH
jgi:hypothetical protein